MRKTIVMSMIVVGLLAGYAGAAVKITSGWSDDFAGYDAYPGGTGNWGMPNNPGDTEPYWLSVQGTGEQIVWEKTGYAPFDVAGVNVYISFHQNATNTAGVELASDVTSGTATLTWLSAMSEYVHPNLFAPTIRVGPLDRDGGGNLTMMEFDGIAVMTVNPDPGNQGFIFYTQQDTTGNFVSSAVIPGYFDTLLANTLTMDMPGKTARWEVKKESDSALVFDSGVFNMAPGDGFTEIAGFMFGTSAGGEPALPVEYGWTNPGYTYTEGGPTPKNRGDVTEDLFVGADDLVRILTHWGESGAGVTWGDGDCAPYGDGITTGDQFVGADDYVEVLSMWGTSYPAEPTPTPEPATLGLLVIGGLALVLKRR